MQHLVQAEDKESLLSLRLNSDHSLWLIAIGLVGALCPRADCAERFRNRLQNTWKHSHQKFREKQRATV